MAVWGRRIQHSGDSGGNEGEYAIPVSNGSDYPLLLEAAGAANAGATSQEIARAMNFTTNFIPETLPQPLS